MTADLFRWPRLGRTVGVVLLMMLAVVGCNGSTNDSATVFDPVVLEAGTRVYDETGDSLSADQIDDLEGRLRALADVDGLGTDAIVYVRSLDANPKATLDQTEALQQAWVEATDADQDVAVVFLVNRNPDDPNDARAGLFVGGALDDGNVPSGRQVEIIDDAVIPPSAG